MRKLLKNHFNTAVFISYICFTRQPTSVSSYRIPSCCPKQPLCPMKINYLAQVGHCRVRFVSDCRTAHWLKPCPLYVSNCFSARSQLERTFGVIAAAHYTSGSANHGHIV